MRNGSLTVQSACDVQRQINDDNGNVTGDKAKAIALRVCLSFQVLPNDLLQGNLYRVLYLKDFFFWYMPGTSHCSVDDNYNYQVIVENMKENRERRHYKCNDFLVFK